MSYLIMVFKNIYVFVCLNGMQMIIYIYINDAIYICPTVYDRRCFQLFHRCKMQLNVVCIYWHKGQQPNPQANIRLNYK